MRKQIITVLSILILLLSNTNASQMIKCGFWEFPTDPSTYTPDWDSLTHVIYMSWGNDGEGTLQSDGTLDFPPYLENYNAVKNEAHSHGSKLIICVSARDADKVDKVLANHQEDLANNILFIVQTYGADGVNFDFEWVQKINSITGTPNIDLIESLMEKVNAKLKAANPDYIVSICIDNGLTDTVWHNAGLNQYVDHAILCGYDYTTPWDSDITGPNAPYDDPTRWDVKDSVNLMLSYYDNQKIILNIPFYGYEYTTKSKNPGARFTQYRYIDMRSAIINSYKCCRIWDFNSHTPWYRYKSGNTWHQVWYDDKKSIKLKYDYAKSENLGGIGFWVLGLEDPCIWKLLK